MRHRLPNLVVNGVTVASLLLCLAVCALWVRSRFVGDYVVVRDGDFDGFHISLARGNVRFAQGSWRGPRGQRMYSCPIEQVGDYSALNSFYVPLWMIALATGVMPMVLWRCSHGRRVPGLCPRCGYDLRATPKQCPECGTATGTVTG